LPFQARFEQEDARGVARALVELREALSEVLVLRLGQRGVGVQRARRGRPVLSHGRGELGQSLRLAEDARGAGETRDADAAVVAAVLEMEHLGF
jgi:hypothetical protein